MALEGGENAVNVLIDQTIFTKVYNNVLVVNFKIKFSLKIV